MIDKNCWIPDLVLYDKFGSSWEKYQEAIYLFFKKDFLDTHPTFNAKRVSVKVKPIIEGKADAFYHVTCMDYFQDGNRLPDFRRCERVKWIRAFIENYQCHSRKCSNCSGIKIWKEPYKSRNRIHILQEEERYVVILEERVDYYLLVTAFYLDYEHSLQKQLKHYEQYK